MIAMLKEANYLLNIILHRLYNPIAQETSRHHSTTDKNEQDGLVSRR